MRREGNRGDSGRGKPTDRHSFLLSPRRYRIRSAPIQTFNRPPKGPPPLSAAKLPGSHAVTGCKRHGARRARTRTRQHVSTDASSARSAIGAHRPRPIVSPAPLSVPPSHPTVVPHPPRPPSVPVPSHTAHCNL
ncbi:hypothetical protein EXIGLDRAFT_114085 [Exidia glandulosa HHB12029]|uniref:Uncharacterized protein n=1 Tax=Exidia glandulosa HHB12029 TaxID=1314781 RepID=A0A165GMH0_EXIGL|nr:hypothetical protein EXIGLDRAFT_114085 [Exidia glandulosa HHB12029]